MYLRHYETNKIVTVSEPAVPHISPGFDLKVDKISVGSSNSKQPDLNYNKTIGDWMINDV